MVQGILKVTGLEKSHLVVKAEELLVLKSLLKDEFKIAQILRFKLTPEAFCVRNTLTRQLRAGDTVFRTKVFSLFN